MNLRLTNLNTRKSVTVHDKTEEQIATFFVNRCGGGYHQFQIESAMRYHAELLQTGSTTVEGCKVELL